MTLLLGATDPNFGALLCTGLRSDAALQIPIGVADNSGDVGITILLPPWDPALRGAVAYSQLVAPTAVPSRIPIVLSNGRRVTWPTRNPGPGMRQDASTVVTAGDDGNLKAWRRDGSRLCTMPHPDAVRSVQLRDDRILTACDDGRVREWKVTGELVREFSAHQGKAYCARWSPDGRSLVTVGRTVRWWNGDGTPIACIVDGAPCWWAELVPDPQRAVIAADDGSVRVVDLDVEAMLRTHASSDPDEAR